VNGRVYADRLEHDYKFECEAGPLHLCNDWVEFRRCFEWLAVHTTPPAAPVQSCYCPNCEALSKEVAALKARPVQEPVAWRFTGIAGFKRFVTDSQYKAFNPEVRAWYEPFKCTSCVTPPAQPAPVQAQEHEPENEPHVSLASVQGNDAHYKGVVEGVQKLFDDKRAQPAQQQWVEVEQVKWDGEKFIAKLKENT
jgi:hypothetical protein